MQVLTTIQKTKAYSIQVIKNLENATTQLHKIYMVKLVHLAQSKNTMVNIWIC